MIYSYKSGHTVLFEITELKNQINISIDIQSAKWEVCAEGWHTTHTILQDLVLETNSMKSSLVRKMSKTRMRSLLLIYFSKQNLFIHSNHKNFIFKEIFERNVIISNRFEDRVEFLTLYNI